jgi:hypothetical protein
MGWSAIEKKVHYRVHKSPQLVAIQFLVYLHAEPNSQWPMTVSTNIKQQ